MKKLITLLFTVCFAFCTVVSADEGVLFENTAPAGLSWTNADVTDAAGIGGKESDDTCAYVGMADGKTSAYYQYDSANGRFDDAFKGNYVIDFNFYPGENFGGSAVKVTTNQGSAVSRDITSASDGFRPGRWNTVRVIYNSTGANQNGYLGVKATYLNGIKLEEIGWYRSYSSPFTVFRIGADSSAGTKNAVYFDDFKIWTTTADPISETPVLSGGEVTGETVYLPQGVTLETVKSYAPSYTITAFRDSTQLEPADTVLPGDILCMRLSDRSYKYCTVSNDGKRTYDSSVFNTDKINIWASSSSTENVSGIFGKPVESDINHRIVSKGQDNQFVFFEIGNVDDLAVTKIPYFTMSVDFLLSKPMKEIYLQYSYMALSTKLDVSALELNKWHRLVLIYEPTTANAGWRGNVSGYIDGKAVGITGDAHAKIPSVKVLRLYFSGNGSDDLDIYFDNCSVYTKWSKDIPESAAALTSGDGYAALGNNLYFTNGVNLPQNVTVWNSGYTAIVTDPELYDDTMHAVLLNSEGVYTYYDLKSAPGFSYSGEGYKGNKTVSKGSDVTASFYAVSAGKLLVACYDAYGLTNTEIFDVDKVGMNDVKFRCNCTNADIIKVMFWSDLQNFVPLCKNDTLTVQ